jgi:3-oxoacyl-[acyl-carrier-protein] synthase II
MANIMRIAVQGIGVAGGFGCGIDQLWSALRSRKIEPQNIMIEAESHKIEFPVYLCDTSRLTDFVNKRSLRRVDHFSRMALLASFLTLEDAGRLNEDHQNLAVVVASGYGATRTTFSFLDSALDGGDACASPTLFSNSVSNAAAAHISIMLKAKGPNITVGQFEMSAPTALLTACRWLQDKHVDEVLFGGVDEYCSVLGYSWQRFFGRVPPVGMRPLDLKNQSAIAGEGAAFFLFTRAEGNTPRYGFVTDIRFGCDRKSGPDFAKDTLVVLGADGHKPSGNCYARCIPARNRAAVYTPLYGSFPTNSAFDMAVAALSIRESKIFATPKYAGDYPGLKIVWQEQGLDSKQISCLKFSCSGEFGIITLLSE